MISILIPTYNYDITSLVDEIHKQLKKLNINFEILVTDDASTDKDVKEKNKTIEKLDFCKLISLEKNIGRSAIRNLLAHKANFETLLFLDSDVIPDDKNFILNYLNTLPTSSDIIYGGILYQKNKPNKNQILRWEYGNKREVATVSNRTKKPYISFLTANFIIKKSTFKKIQFYDKIPNILCEDILFALDAKANNIQITHINNPVIHLGLETSEIFLKKSLESVGIRQLFITKKILNPKDTKITLLANQIKRLRVRSFFVFFHKLSKSYFKKNLLSESPSLLFFDLYRLGYYFENDNQI